MGKGQSFGSAEGYRAQPETVLVDVFYLGHVDYIYGISGPKTLEFSGQIAYI